MPSTIDLNDLRAVALERAAWAREGLLAIVRGVPDEHLFTRCRTIGDGADVRGCGNHAAWVLGHLAVTEDVCVSVMTGEPHALDAAFHERYRGGTAPADAPAGQPSREELERGLAATRRRLVAWYKSLDADALTQPAPEFIRPLFPDARTLPLAMACHEMFHAGQVAAVRSALGLPRLIG